MLVCLPSTPIPFGLFVSRNTLSFFLPVSFKVNVLAPQSNAKKNTKHLPASPPPTTPACCWLLLLANRLFEKKSWPALVPTLSALEVTARMGTCILLDVVNPTPNPIKLQGCSHDCTCIEPKSQASGLGVVSEFQFSEPKAPFLHKTCCCNHCTTHTQRTPCPVLAYSSPQSNFFSSVWM